MAEAGKAKSSTGRDSRFGLARPVRDEAFVRRRCAARLSPREVGEADVYCCRSSRTLPQGSGNGGEGAWARDLVRRVGLVRLTRRCRARAGKARTARQTKKGWRGQRILGMGGHASG